MYNALTLKKNMILIYTLNCKKKISHILPQYEHGTPSISSSSKNPSKQDPMVDPCKTKLRICIVKHKSYVNVFSR